MDRNDGFGKKIDEHSKKLDKILFYLESDDATKQKGLVERASILEERVGELVKAEAVFKGKATVWGIVGGGVLSGLIYIGKFLFMKIGLL